MIEEHTRDETPGTGRALKKEGYLSMVLSADIDCQDVLEDDQDIHCNIKFNPLEGEELTVGKIGARLIDREQAHKAGWTDLEIFDVSSANWEIYEQVYLCQPRIPERLGINESNSNILVIHTVDVLPQYRGLNFSLIALRSLIRHFRLKAGLVVIQLLPSQFLSDGQIVQEEDEDPDWLNRMDLEKFSKDELKSRIRLQCHFAKLGFFTVPETEYMIADPLRELPTADVLRLNARPLMR